MSTERRFSPSRGGDQPVRHQRLRNALVAGAILSFGVAAASSTLAAGVSGASSHREAPLIGGDPRADNTDTYAFVSPDNPDTVTLLGNWIPFEEPNGGPNFYPFATDAKYDINIDNDGDGVADVVYRWVFTDHIRDDAGQFLYNTGPGQQADRHNAELLPDLRLDPDHRRRRRRASSRTRSSHRRTSVRRRCRTTRALRDEAIKSIDGGGKTFAGQADDSFFLDLRVFDLLYGTNLKEAGQDTLDGLQRQHHRAAGPQGRSRGQGQRQGQPRDRCVEHDAAQGRVGVLRRRRRSHARTGSSRCRASATRWSTRSSFRSSSRTRSTV